MTNLLASVMKKLLDDFAKDLAKPKDPNYDYTPVFHMGQVVGCVQDIKDGKLDPTDNDTWKP